MKWNNPKGRAGFGRSDEFRQMHSLFPKRVLDTVLDAMIDHEKLSLEVLDNETKSRAFALVILQMLKRAAAPGESGVPGV